MRESVCVYVFNFHSFIFFHFSIRFSSLRESEESLTLSGNLDPTPKTTVRHRLHKLLGHTQGSPVTSPHLK